MLRPAPLFFIAWFILAAVTRADLPETRSLGGAWEVCSNDDPEHPIPATVPGCIHTDLRAAGKIPDPFYRDNENKLQWIGDKAWTYRRSFDVPAAFLTHEFVLLRCEGLDTIATVRVNGLQIARTDNMFRTYEFDMRQALHPGANTLEITFDATAPFIHPKDVQPAFPGLGGDFIRKEPCNYGWDFGPKFVTCGIWKPISLVGYDHARWQGVLISQDHHDAKMVRLDLDLSAQTDGKLGLAADVMVRNGDQVFHAAQPLEDGHGRITINVPDPRLWWPNGMGPQNLYRVEVTLHGAHGAALDRIVRTIGLRTIEWQPKTDQHPMGFSVNGRPFFAKGANWIPCEVFATQVTDAKLARYVDDAKATGMNFLRFWGGGYYEEDALYQKCDEAGLLVWLDLKFACNNYPGYDPDFMANVRAEANDNILRLRDHPCIAIWCGNNECLLNNGDRWVNGISSRSDYDRLFETLLGSEVHALAPSANYTPGSPQAGDAHYWQVWHGGAPFEAYDNVHGFVAEFGFQSFPEPRTVRAFTAPGDRTSPFTPVMVLHQKNGDGHGNERIVQTINRYFRQPKDFDSMLWVSQMLQAYGIKEGVEYWRGEWPRSTGSLIWQYDDCWPGMTWSSVDYFGRWKALQYAVRHFYAPLLVAGRADPDTGQAEISVASDRAEAVQVKLSWSVTDLDGFELAQGTAGVDVPAGTVAVKAATLDLRAPLGEVGSRNCLLWLKLAAEGKTVSENLLTFVRPKFLDLRDPAIRAQVEGAGSNYTVTLSATHPALYAWLEVQDVDARFSDNFVPLRADEPVAIQVTTAKPLDAAQFQAALRVRSLYDTYYPGPPAQTDDKLVGQAGDGPMAAVANKAEIVGDSAVLEDDGVPDIGHWTDADDYLRWTLVVKAPGTFQVIVDQSMEPGSAGATYVVAAEDSSVEGKVVGTKSLRDYVPVPIGTIHIDRIGAVDLTLKPLEKPHGLVMNLRSVRLVPVATPPGS